MVNCETYKAEIPDKTCISRIKIIRKNQHGKNWGNSGGQTGLAFQHCGKCELGNNIYEKHLKGELMEEKFCNTCKKALPKDLNHFDAANRSSDKLTRDCKVCRGSEYSSSEDSSPTEKMLQTRYVLDLKDHPELVKKLEQWAADNMRTVSNQIIFHLIHVAMAKRYVH